MPPTTIIDLTRLDLDNVVADTDAIEAIIPHRHGMRMIDAIVHVDHEQHLIAAYKDVRDDEFWGPGHMPGYPIFPGVLMCEGAAQMACYYTLTHGWVFPGYLGLGGVENARFRTLVRPGDRLVYIGRGVKVDRRKVEFEVQGYVGNSMAFNLNVIGVPLPAFTKMHELAAVGANGVGG